MGISQQLFKNVLTSWVSYAIRLVVGFLFVPYIVSVFGTERYGVWVIIFQAISYLSLFDLGLERAVIRFSARYYAQQDYRALARTLSTSQAILIILSPVVLVGVVLVAPLLFNGLQLSHPQLRSEGELALIIIGFLLASRFSLGVINHALSGLQRFDLLNGLDIFEEVFRVGSMVLLLRAGYGMVALAVSIVGVSLIRQVIAFVLLRRCAPDVRWNPTKFDRENFRELFRYAKMSFGITLAWLVIFNSDSILLGLLASTAAAGIYAPAAQLMLYMRHAVNAIGIPLAPAVSHLDAKKNSEAVARTYLSGLKYVSFVSVFLSVGVLLYAKAFVGLWLPSDFGQTADVMMILAIGSAVFLPQIIGNSVLFGIERHRYLFYVLLAEATLKLGLSFMLIGPYGPIGMAIAAAVPQVILYLTLYPYFMSRVLGIPVWRFLASAWRSGLVALAVSVPLGLVLRFLVAPAGWLQFFADITILTVITLTVGFLVVLESQDRARIAKFLKPSNT